MLEIAKKKTKSVNFVFGDMSDFNLNKKFDFIYNVNWGDIIPFRTGW